MKRTIAPLTLSVLFAAGLLAGCSSGDESADASAPAASSETTYMPAAAVGEAVELAPGSTFVITATGSGEPVQPGDIAVVHYTGWLFDESAPENRGTKFDSSVDRGVPFNFPLGAGRVIRGWDQGVAGMQVGETRILTLAPDMAYGDRGAGNVIPPGATLIFEVQLNGIEGRDPT